MITELRYLWFTFALAVSCGNALAETHCKPDEMEYFSCKIKNSPKIVSLCGDVFVRNIDNAIEWGKDGPKVREDAWLQYRFGKPGKLELVYPTDTKDSLRKFKAEYDRHNRGFDATISFVNGGFTYVLAILEGAELEKDYFYGIMLAPVNNNAHVKPATRLSCQNSPGGSSFFDLTMKLDPNKIGQD